MEFLFFALAGAYITFCIVDARKAKERARRINRKKRQENIYNSVPFMVQ